MRIAPPVFTDCVVHVDLDKAQQVLLNLLANAVKFGPSGSQITIRCDSACGDGGDAQVAISVQDTGTGIPPDQLEHIFTPFVQLDGSLTRTAEGTGLGLAIGRDLARGMGGDLTVESTVGVGSCFTLTLPAA